MFGWIKKRNNYPNFWNAYVANFSKEHNYNFETTRFVVFDTETTGFNLKKDKILSFGAVAVQHKNIVISDSFECFVKQDYFNPNTVPIHGILKTNYANKLEQNEAITAFLAYIKDAVLVAHNAQFDISMVNKALQQMKLPKLKNKYIDTAGLYKDVKRLTYNDFSLDDLCKEFNIKKHDRHTAQGDAYITALLFLKLLHLGDRNLYQPKFT